MCFTCFLDFYITHALIKRLKFEYNYIILLLYTYSYLTYNQLVPLQESHHLIFFISGKFEWEISKMNERQA